MAEFLKRHWTQIRAQASQMPANTRWLVGSLIIILLLAGYLIVQYAAEPEMVPITNFAGERQADVAERLKQRGIEVRVEGEQIFVPYDQQVDALVAMQSAGLMAADTSRAFDEMIQNTSPWDPSSKTRLAFIQAKQKFLSQVISKMKNVRAADVVLSVPNDRKFGRNYVKPSASVNVVMDGGTKVDKPLMEAIAGFVSGAVAEMTPRDVVVIDAADGRAHRVPGDDELASDQSLEIMAQVEKFHRTRIVDALRYIPGVIVAVNVRTDAIQRQDVEEWKYNPTEPLESEKNELVEMTGGGNSGAPGVRSNLGADIVGANSNASTSTSEKSETRYRDLPLTMRSRSRKLGHVPEEINVTVNVPRTYFVSLYQKSQGDEAAAPTIEQLQPIVEEQLEAIRKQVLPLIRTADSQGMVTAHMILDSSAMIAAAQAGGGGGGVLGLGDGEVMQYGPVIALALLSVGLMFYMVRRTTRQPPMPTVEELAGVPPRLDADGEIVGEVDRAEQAMEGLELDEQDLQTRRVAEQIGELIAAHPEEAASLFKRWMRAETA